MVLASAVSAATVASVATVATAGAGPEVLVVADVGSGPQVWGQALGSPWGSSVPGPAVVSAVTASAATAAREEERAKEARWVTRATATLRHEARLAAREGARWTATSILWAGAAFQGQVQVEGVASE